MTGSRPRPPDGLDQAGRRFWRGVVVAYDLAPGELELLRQACRTVDLLERIDDQLSREDLTVAGSRGQQRGHPLLLVSVEQRRTLDGLLNALALPMPNELEGRRRSRGRWRRLRRGGVSIAGRRVDG
jgi:hypothetical protein